MTYKFTPSQLENYDQIKDQEHRQMLMLYILISELKNKKVEEDIISSFINEMVSCQLPEIFKIHYK